MKRLFILFAIVFVSLLCSCEKEETFVPATISGDWVFSAVNTGAEWKALQVKSILVFDGSGTYTISNLKAELPGVYYEDGKLDVEREDFVSHPDKVYTAQNSSSKYRFSSVKGDFELVESSNTEMQFKFISEDTAIRGYKLSKVTAYNVHIEPEEPIDPDKPSINGTALIEGNDLVGLVFDSTTGKGIAGVVVSDGYDCVATDANGVYQFKSNSLSRVVYISTPAEYKVPVVTSPSVPVFYKEIKPDGSVIRTDFKLVPLPEGKETKWIFVGIGDPQCATSSNASRYSSETIPDIKKATANEKSVYAMTLGDIVFDSTDMWPSMKASMASVYNGAWYIPFFQCIGNHDHDSLKEDTTDNAKDDYNATSTFVSTYGPTDYSFNRGDVHVIAMDDIIVTSKKSSSKSNKFTWSYNAGFTAKQVDWLKKDLELVENKAEKMVFICCHIPFKAATSNYYPTVLSLLSEFKEVHLMIGHTHYTQNYIYTNSRKGKGGLPFYEHIHGSACGAWWTSSCSSTVSGEPSGYTIYYINGAHIDDWQFKGTKRDSDFQLRVFNGNDIYHQEKYPLNWYTSSQKIGTLDFVVKGNPALQNCFVAQVFNDDDTYWKVELVKKSTGAKIGDFKRIANGGCSNIAMSSHYYNVKGKTSDSYRSWTASHYWYYKPASGNPANETDWEVVATQTLPGNTASHVYKCSKLTVQSEFEKEFYF